MDRLSDSPAWKRQLKETELSGRRSQYNNLEFKRDDLIARGLDTSEVDVELAVVAAAIAKLEEDLRKP
jgi:hypothetical protein